MFCCFTLWLFLLTMTRCYSADKIDRRTTQVVLKVYEDYKIQAVFTALFSYSNLASVNVSVLSLSYGYTVTHDLNQFVSRAFAIVNGAATPEQCEVHDSIF